jgi:hypothetical protein
MSKGAHRSFLRLPNTLGSHDLERESTYSLRAISNPESKQERTLLQTNNSIELIKRYFSRRYCAIASVDASALCSVTTKIESVRSLRKISRYWCYHLRGPGITFSFFVSVMSIVHYYPAQRVFSTLDRSIHSSRSYFFISQIETFDRTVGDRISSLSISRAPDVTITVCRALLTALVTWSANKTDRILDPKVISSSPNALCDTNRSSCTDVSISKI